MNELLPVGRVSKPHGLNGEVSVFLYSGNTDSISELERLFFCKEEHENPLEFQISTRRFRNNKTIIGLEGIDTIEDALELRGSIVMVHKRDLPEPNEDEYYWFQLIGLDVVSVDGEFIGKVSNLIDREPQSLLVVVNDEKEFLVPMVDTIVEEVKLGESKVIIRPIKGLLD